MNTNFETDILHFPYERNEVHNALAMPVYHCAAYEFSSVEEMEDAFLGKNTRHTYSRITNPTVQHLEQSVQKVTGALGLRL